MNFRKIYLWLEFAVLAIGVPLLFYFHISRPLMTSCMWGGALLAIVWLRYYRKIGWRQLWQGNQSRASRANHVLAIQLILGAVIGTALLHTFDPELLFRLPLQRPAWWAIIMVLYPLLSALPQEVIYRSFFFERYQPLFNNRWVMIVASAASFGFLHIMFQNWVAPLLSLWGGLIFAYSYDRDKSLKWVAIEHALYGCMIFTIGLGYYFFLGAMRPMG